MTKSDQEFLQTLVSRIGVAEKLPVKGQTLDERMAAKGLYWDNKAGGYVFKKI